jgi:drug/metabolite transporter (DMT)-like permease
VSGRHIADLLLLGALWGASFLFMRMGAADFGAAPLVFVRVAGASLVLVPLLLLRGQGGAVRAHWRAIAVVGLINSALPFLLFMVAALVLTAGLMGIFNATAPIWAAVVGWLWLGERLGRARVVGLLVGLAGVTALAWDRAEFKTGPAGVSPALGIAACVLATLLYGVGANYTRQRLAGVPALAVAAGSQLAATLMLALPALWSWPAATPGPLAWGAATALALACTALAYLLFFRLIAQAGAANAISVTLLIPAFAMVWGWLFLGERPTLPMLAGCAVILLGTALSTGLIRWPRRG